MSKSLVADTAATFKLCDLIPDYTVEVVASDGVTKVSTYVKQNRSGELDSCSNIKRGAKRREPAHTSSFVKSCLHE